MKLISMTDFVLQKSESTTLPLTIQETFKEGAKITNEIFKYANFLKQPLKLEMFVPCDDLGNFLKQDDNTCQYDFEVYQQAKEKVFFEEFEFFDKHQNCLNNMLGDFGVFKDGDDFGVTTHEKGKGYHTYFHIKNIEDLIRIEKGITLTENALKQLQIINNK